MHFYYGQNFAGYYIYTVYFSDPQPIYNNVNTMPVKKKNKVLHVILGIVTIIVGIIIYALSYSCSYNKTREYFDSRNSSYSYSSSYSNASKDYNDESSTRQFEFSVDYVKGSYLEGYEDKTIGTAFDGAFDETDWSYSKEGNIQYVEFIGVYDDLGIYLNFYYNPSVHNEYEFTLDTDTAIIMNLNTEEWKYLSSYYSSLLNYIYNDGIWTPVAIWGWLKYKE